MSKEVHLRDAVLTIYAKPLGGSHEYTTVVTKTLSNLVSESEFENVELFSSSLFASGVLSIPKELANDNHRICGPAQVLVVLDEEKLLPDRDRSDNSFLTHVVISCPGELLAAVEFKPSVSSFLNLHADPISWTYLPQSGNIVLKKSTSTEIDFTIKLWNPKSVLLSDNQIVVEGFEIKEKSLFSNTGFETRVEISPLEILDVVDDFENSDFISYNGHLKFTVNDRVCEYLSENKVFESFQGTDNVARGLTWNLKVNYEGNDYIELIEYNNRIELVTDLICNAQIDLVIPKLPEQGEFLLLGLNGIASVVEYGAPLSFRIQIEINLMENTRASLCDLKSNSDRNELEAAVCSTGSLKSDVMLLISLDLSKETTENAVLHHAFANKVVSLSMGKRVSIWRRGIAKKIVASFDIKDLLFDEDDVFQLCCEPSSELHFQVK